MVEGMAVPFKPECKHRKNLCLHRKIRSKRVRHSTSTEVIRVGVCVVVVAGVVGIGVMVKNSTAQPTTQPYVCTTLTPIPPPPIPTPEQDFARAYTNSILETIRKELGCG